MVRLLDQFNCVVTWITITYLKQEQNEKQELLQREYLCFTEFCQELGGILLKFCKGRKRKMWKLKKEKNEFCGESSRYFGFYTLIKKMER